MYEMKCMTNGFFVGNTIVKIVGNGMGEDHLHEGRTMSYP
jgi:hypothetical protein